MHVTILDRVDAQLVSALSKDARSSFADLARLVKRGESTVRERVASLERHRVIVGYRAIVDAAQVGYPVQAILRAARGSRPAEELAKELSGIPHLQAAYLTTGPRPLVIHVAAGSLPELERLMEERISRVGLTDIEPQVVIQTLVAPKSLTPRPVEPVPETRGSRVHRRPETNGIGNGHGTHRPVVLENFAPSPVAPTS